MAKRIFPKKPKIPKIRIIKHGSGYETYDGREKINPTTTLTRATSTARGIEKEYKQRLKYWLKYRRK